MGRKETSESMPGETVPGIIVIAYERQEANFFLGHFRDVKGKKVFQSEARWVRLEPEDEKPVRIAQLPLKFTRLAEKYPQRNLETKRRMAFDIPHEKFRRWARAHAINKQNEIKAKTLESTFTDLLDLDDGLLEDPDMK